MLTFKKNNLHDYVARSTQSGCRADRKRSRWQWYRKIDTVRWKPTLAKASALPGRFRDQPLGHFIAGKPARLEPRSVRQRVPGGRARHQPGGVGR